MPLLLSRAAAQALLEEWVHSPSLRRHCLAVSLAVRAYAVKLGGDEEQWGVAGLLHDMDYERHPDLDDPQAGHPRTAMRVLQDMDVDPVVVRAIASHADFLGVSRDSDLEHVLFACDELCGFLLACAYVRPQGLHGLTARSVRKKLKAPGFAAAVNRDDVRGGADELGVEFDEHLTFVIAALEPHAAELGADGSPDAGP